MLMLRGMSPTCAGTRHVKCFFSAGSAALQCRSSHDHERHFGAFTCAFSGALPAKTMTVCRRLWRFLAEAIRRKITALQRLVGAAVLSLAKNGENGRKRSRLVALGQSQDALGDVAQDELLADRRDA